ncbi:MAG: KPN_02809 family neutral zinc metallopeptidase [Beijerinckiaceae bacterium]
MKWQDFGRSDNVEDRRGQGGGVVGRGGLGIGTMVVLGLLGWALGIDPRILIGGAEMVNSMRQGGQSAVTQTGTPSDDMGQFVAAVLAANETVWTEVLPRQKGIPYAKPKLVLYSGRTVSGCGGAQSAMGPFYCPLDQKVYLDTSFFQDMKRSLGGGGEFAYTYVVAHEIGHHVQNLLGILPKVQAAQQRAVSRGDANNLSVRAELMADCLAGVWAANAERKYQFLEAGDLETAVATAQAIGDDRLQQAAQGFAVPDSFTHGSAAQRVQWLNAGLKSGQVDNCNTFAR